MRDNSYLESRDSSSVKSWWAKMRFALVAAAPAQMGGAAQPNSSGVLPMTFLPGEGNITKRKQWYNLATQFTVVMLIDVPPTYQHRIWAQNRTIHQSNVGYPRGMMLYNATLWLSSSSSKSGAHYPHSRSSRSLSIPPLSLKIIATLFLPLWCCPPQSFPRLFGPVIYASRCHFQCTYSTLFHIYQANATGIHQGVKKKLNSWEETGPQYIWTRVGNLQIPDG